MVRAVLDYWRILALLCLVLTSMGRIGLISEHRNEVRELFVLKQQEQRLLKENKSLTLERSVLTRPTRLRDYAQKNLNLNKPRQVRQIGSD